VTDPGRPWWRTDDPDQLHVGVPSEDAERRHAEMAAAEEDGRDA